MSVALTIDQVRAGTKTVTRRLGWRYLKPGDRLQLCEKVRGRRAGEQLVRLRDVVVVAVDIVRLDSIDQADVVAEGFPSWTPHEFIEFFCRTHPPANETTEVTRIEWRYVTTEDGTHR
jgi:hypothetical protein